MVCSTSSLRMCRQPRYRYKLASKMQANMLQTGGFASPAFAGFAFRKPVERDALCKTMCPLGKSPRHNAANPMNQYHEMQNNQPSFARCIATFPYLP